MEHRLFLSFYGTPTVVETECRDIIDVIRHDFSYFTAATPSQAYAVQIFYFNQTPPYNTLPEMIHTMATPRNICYASPDKTYIDYFGKALNVFDKKNNTFHLYSEDEELAREIIYLTILSRVSEILDKRHIHRIHALGLEYKKNGVLLLLPCGGGKSTFAMALLRAKDSLCKLISEDSPLLDHGMLLPFPLRIGIHPESLPDDIPGDFVRTFKRMEFCTKTTIDSEYFSERLCRQPVKTSAILIGVRSTSDKSEIKPVSKFGVLKYCFMNSVIGIGLYQGMEFMMQKNATEIIRHGFILMSRIKANLSIILCAKTFVFILGRNVNKNADTLNKFLRDSFEPPVH